MDEQELKLIEVIEGLLTNTYDINHYDNCCRPGECPVCKSHETYIEFHEEAARLVAVFRKETKE